MASAALFSDVSCFAAITTPTERTTEYLSAFCNQLMGFYNGSICNVTEILTDNPSFRLDWQCNSSFYLPIVIQANETECRSQVADFLCLPRPVQPEPSIALALAVGVSLAFVLVSALVICSQLRRRYREERDHHQQAGIVVA